MALDSLIHISCDSNVERTIPAFQHVTKPGPLDPSFHPASSITGRLAARGSSEFVKPATNSLDLFVRGVLPARIAKFRRLEPVLMLLPVLRGRVVAILTIAAL
jgi:hypothetical protein